MTTSITHPSREDQLPNDSSPVSRLLIGPIERLGSTLLTLLEAFGNTWIFLWKIVVRIFTPPFYWGALMQQFRFVGAQSVSVVCLVGVFTGAVLAVQGVYTLSKFGATAYTGSAIALSLIRELGPVLTALMVNGRAGSAMTAELGIMKITEQIDALRSMAVDPLRYLMVPRLLAGFFTVPLLTAMFIAVGIAGGYIVAVGTLGLSSGSFYSEMTQAVNDVDIIAGFVKSIVFGIAVTWIACYKGWTCGFGAVGVNKATTSAVVTSSVVILIMDYFLTSILTQVLP